MKTKVHKNADLDLTMLTEEISELLPDLVARRDYIKKVEAKNSLISMGKSILPQLQILLCAGNPELRIIAAKAIQQIGAEESVNLMIVLLEDEESSIRWIAAKGLILVGRKSIIPLLRTLVKRRKTQYLKAGAHYVLSHLFNYEEKTEFNTLLTSLTNNQHLGLLTPVEAAKVLKVYRNEL
jgi:HEAT repeat protein